MLKISVDGGVCHFEGEGSSTSLDVEMTCAGAAIITEMSKINHCSFEAAALILLQKCSLIYKDNIKEFDFNTDK